MNPDQQKIDKLEKQVAELLEWKRQKIQQQISFPLDKASYDVMSQFIPVWGERIASAPPEYEGAVCKLGGKKIAFLVVDPSIYE